MDEKRHGEPMSLLVEYVERGGGRRPSCADALKEAQREAMAALTPRERILLSLRLGQMGRRLAGAKRQS